MEALLPQDSLQPAVSSTDNKDDQISSQAQESPWTGVESREVVLRQFQDASDIVVIDVEEEELTARPPAAKRRRLADHISTDNGGRQVVDRCYISTTIPQRPSEMGASNPSDPFTSKKRLFQSGEARQNMSRLVSATLLTPPTSPDDDSHHPDVLEGDSESAAQLSMNLSRFFKVIEGQQSSTPGKTTTDRVKSHIQAAGLARSQQLRARRQQEQKDEAKTVPKQRSSLVSILEEAGLHPRSPQTTTIPKPGNTVTRDQRVNLFPDTVSDQEIENLLDIAQAHAKNQSQSTPNASKVPAANGRVDRESHLRNHPSRTIAERSRVQDRHPEHSIPGQTTKDRTEQRPRSPVLLESHLAEQRRKDERLQRLARSALGPPSDSKPKGNGIRTTGALSTTFHAPDFGSSSRTPHSQTKKQPDRQDLRKLMGTPTTPRTIQASKEKDTSDGRNERMEEASTEELRPKVSLAMLEQFSAGKTGVADSAQLLSGGRPDTQDVYDTLPPQGTDLKLHKCYERQPAHIQKMMEEHETLKERLVDLKAIVETFQETARFGATTSFQDVQLREMVELKKFSEAVLVKQLSGRPVRARIRNIQGNMKRRIQRLNVQPTRHRVDEVLEDIMQAEYAEKLGEIPILEARLSHLKLELRKRHDQPRDGLQKVSSMPKKQKTHLSKSEASRLAFERSQDRRIASLQAQLSGFTRNVGANNQEDSEPEVIDLGGPIDDTRSVTSEEDGGEESMRPIGLESNPTVINNTSVPHVEGSNIIEHGQSHQGTREPQAALPQRPLPQQSVQAHSHTLLEQMLAKGRQQEHMIQQGTQGRDLQLLRKAERRRASRTARARIQAGLDDDQINSNQASAAVIDADVDLMSDPEFEDSDLDDEERQEGEGEGEGDDSDKPQCWRYNIMLLECSGITTELEAHEVIQGAYLNYDKAKTAVEKLVTKCRHDYKTNHNTATDRYWNTRIEEDNEKYDLVMTHVDNDAVGCHFRIEKKLYNPSAEAYEKAKVQEACRPIEAWFVDWVKTISVVTEHAPESEIEDKIDSERAEGDEHEQNEEQDQEASNNLTADDVNDESVEDLQPQPNTAADHTEPIEALKDVDETHNQPEQPTSSSGHQETIVNEESTSNPHEPTSQDNDNPTSPPIPLLNDEEDDHDSLFGSEPDISPPEPQPTLTPTPPSSTSTSNSSATNPLSSSPPPPTPSPPNLPHPNLHIPSSITTRATADDLTLFTSLAHANRHASKLFLQWYKSKLHSHSHSHSSGSLTTDTNQNMLESKQDDIEEELAYMGEKEMWSGEDEFPITCDSENGSGDDGENRDADGGCSIGGDGVERRERFRVWVRRAVCFGPRN